MERRSKSTQEPLNSMTRRQFTTLIDQPAPYVYEGMPLSVSSKPTLLTCHRFLDAASDAKKVG